MSVIHELHEITFKFYSVLCDDSIKRSDKVDLIQEYQSEIQPLLELLPKEKTPETTKLLEEIQNIYPKIKDKMVEIQSDIKKDIARVQNTKKFSNQKPVRSKEGTFFDMKS